MESLQHTVNLSMSAIGENKGMGLVYAHCPTGELHSLGEQLSAES